MAIEQKKKKKVSKKLKSSWRKHVNIQDVEDFLEDKRLEEGSGPPLSTIKNDELFKVDKCPSEKLLTAKERRELKREMPLKCFSALLPYTKVPDPISKRNRVKTKEERKNDLIKLKEMKNMASGILKAKEIQANKDRKLNEERRKIRHKHGELNVDLWSDENDKGIQIGDIWVENNTKKHNLCGLGTLLKNTRKSIAKKQSHVRPIEPPHPGMSYNPSYNDHQDLLKIVADKETKLIKEEAHLARVTTGMFQKVPARKRDESWLIEMSEGLPSKSGTNAEDNEASGDAYCTVNPPVQNLKKTLKQRRKQQEQKKLQKAKLMGKQEKKKITDIHNLKILKKKLQQLEANQNIAGEKRKKTLELKKKKPKMLGSLKYEEPDLEFTMGQEIAGNLKNLKAEGNLLTDRFKSMQKRNILAPTKRQTHKKPKFKRYTKPGHKDEVWKKTVAR